MSKGLSKASRDLLDRLLTGARNTVSPKLAADFLSQVEGMVAIASIEGLISQGQQTAIWSQINGIKAQRGMQAAGE